MPKLDDTPEMLKPYVFHGVNIAAKPNNNNAYGDCPFCGREGKFAVTLDEGVWRCVVCNEGSDKTNKHTKGGNAYTFIRKLWEVSDQQTTPADYQQLATEKGFLYPESIMVWGLAKSLLTSSWIVPGYNEEGKMNQLYKYVYTQGRWMLLPTVKMGHQIHGMPLFDPEKPIVYICEGWGDGVAWWEVLGKTRESEGRFVPTADQKSSLLAEANVIALPVCNTFNENWIPLFSGKDVRLMYDSDHPKRICSICRKTYSTIEHSSCPNMDSCGGNLAGQEIEPAGYSGALRIAETLAGSSTPPSSVSILHWGDNGYDESKPSGYDLRDSLTGSGKALASRLTRAKEILDLTYIYNSEGPSENENGVEESSFKVKSRLNPIPCTSYKELINAWRKAMKWTDGLDRALSVMLASILSTNAVGDQLWIKVLGPASCGKTTLAEALAVARKYVTIKDTIRGFTSGFITTTGKAVDLVSELDKMTMITTDGDTLLQSPNLANILSEGRRLYDGSLASHFKNGSGADVEGHRMTWLLCGTGSLRLIDASELGERFLDNVIMEEIDDDLEDEIIWRAANKAHHNLSIEANGTPENYQSPEMTLAMKMTGGYVEYLRGNSQSILSGIKMDDDTKRLCTRFGKFVAYMRARPSKKQEENSERELAARLVTQHTRLAICLAGVMNRAFVDDESMRRTRKVCLDTARGQTLDIGKHIQADEEKSLEVKAIAYKTHKTDDKTRGMLRFLKQIGVVETFHEGDKNARQKWRLTEKMDRLWGLVYAGDR